MVEYWRTFKFPFTVKSFPTYTLPFNDASEVNNKWLLIVASPVTLSPAPAVNNPLVVIVLLVKVSMPAKVAKVPVEVGKVTVAEPFVIDEITGAVKVLLVNVSMPAKVDNVCVPVGIVIVPELEIEEIIGAFRVLFNKI